MRAAACTCGGLGERGLRSESVGAHVACVLGVPSMPIAEILASSSAAAFSSEIASLIA